jgi:DNA polymerase III epsilon subunit-like protein
MKSSERLIAMTDIEASGDVPGVHEILEIGLVLFDQNTFEIKKTFHKKIKPVRIENSIAEAIEVNGYKEEDWVDAVPLIEAMREYAVLTQEAIFCAYNVAFDWAFINQAFWECGIPNPMSTKANHDKLDMLSIAWIKGLKGGESISLRTACQKWDIPPEPLPHSALNGAMTAYELYKKLI